MKIKFVGFCSLSTIIAIMAFKALMTVFTDDIHIFVDLVSIEKHNQFPFLQQQYSAVNL